jgi:hypothetical protein
MPTISVVRLATEGPRIGSDYEFERGARRFRGIVVGHQAMRKAKTHVHVTVRLTPAEHTRLSLGN